MIDYADINTNEKARKYCDEHIAYMKMMGNRYFKDEVIIDGKVCEIEMDLDVHDEKVANIWVENKTINEFKLGQNQIRVWFSECYIKRFEVAKNINYLGIEKVIDSEIDMFIVSDQDTLVNSLHMYLEDFNKTVINQMCVKFTKNSKAFLDRSVMKWIDSTLKVKKLEILVDISLVGPFTIDRDLYRYWKVDELKEALPEIGDFERLSVVENIIQIFYYKDGKLHLIGLNMDTIDSKLKQLIWNEFAYTLAAELDHNESEFKMQLIDKDGTILKLEEFTE